MGRTTEDEARDFLHRLEGHELGAVTFVRDYIQLHFEGPLLNAYVWPVVVAGNERYSPGMREYRDELCARIGCMVSLAIEAKDVVAISFSDGSLMEISLRNEDRSGPEAILLDDGSGQVWSVW
ncbi:conserved hypothetical protein [Cupriavidus necator]|uniref:Uncharacterized protein n=1 Tax=Cupriavidus necator TaxID=106590 RepID=A0A1K0JAR6_CUPNE|nr:conserved hypothetical protein [Cupriavidus necator]